MPMVITRSSSGGCASPAPGRGWHCFCGYCSAGGLRALSSTCAASSKRVRAPHRAMGGRTMLIMSLAALAGCGAAPAPSTAQPQPLTLAVIEFGDAGRDAENGCVMAALEAGFRVVSREQLAAALPSDDTIDYRQLGR